MINVNRINMGKIGKKLSKFEGSWVAVSKDSKIVGHSKSYKDLASALKTGKKEAILLKVPPTDALLSP